MHGAAACRIEQQQHWQHTCVATALWCEGGGRAGARRPRDVSTSAARAHRWIGNLSIACRAPTELVFSWNSSNYDRGVFVNQTAPGFGAIRMHNVRMLMSQAFVCGGNYTAQQCASTLQVRINWRAALATRRPSASPPL